MLRLEVLIVAIIYVLGTSIGLGIYQARKRLGMSSNSFLYADKSLSPWVLGAAVALANLGAVHVVGLMETGGTMGLVAMWMMVAVAFSMALDLAFIGPYYRKLNVNTFPEIIGKLYDPKCRSLASLIGIFAAFAVLSLETQGGGIVLAALTGIDVRTALAIFMVCAAAYVIITGQWQVAYLDLINAVVTYASIVIGFIIIAIKLPAGWSGVESFYIGKGAADVLHFWPKDPGLLFGFAIALVIAVSCFRPQDQGNITYFLCARDVPTARKGSLIALFLNLPFGFFTTLIGLAAMSIPEFASGGPKMAGVLMMLGYLPAILSGLLLAAFLALVLSTWARFTMGISQIIINDFFVRYSKKPEAEKERVIVWLSRVLVLVPGIASVVPAYFLPKILLAAMFAFSIGIPAFVVLLLGLFWRRNSTAAFLTMLLTLAGSFLWEFAQLPTKLGLPGWFSTPYFALVFSIITGVVLTVILPNEKGFIHTKDISVAEA